MSTQPEDPLLAELRELPGARLAPGPRARALAHAEAALAASTRPRPWWRRWASVETLVPAVLCLGGLLYAAGAVRAIAQVYGPGPASATHAAAAPRDPRYSLGGAGLKGGSALRTPLVLVARR